MNSCLKGLIHKLSYELEKEHSRFVLTTDFNQINNDREIMEGLPKLDFDYDTKLAYFHMLNEDRFDLLNELKILDELNVLPEIEV